MFLSEWKRNLLSAVASGNIIQSLTRSSWYSWTLFFLSCYLSYENLKTSHLKVHYCRFENLPTCLCSYKNNTLKISYKNNILRYFPMKFVNFLKSRLIFNICYCFWMFINKLFTYAHISESKRCFNMKSSTYCFNMKSLTYYYHMKTKI